MKSPQPERMVRTSGQLGLGVDGTVPEVAEAQAAICFDNIEIEVWAAA